MDVARRIARSLPAPVSVRLQKLAGRSNRLRPAPGLGDRPMPLAGERAGSFPASVPARWSAEHRTIGSGALVGMRGGRRA